VSRYARWVVVALVALLFARQIPELRRYLKIRSM
jgi:hypothetical protein